LVYRACKASGNLIREAIPFLITGLFLLALTLSSRNLDSYKAVYREEIKGPQLKSKEANETPKECLGNEYYLVVDTQTNIEKLVFGDPNCMTGEVRREFVVATGKNEMLLNPAGWWYFGATPQSKWKIVSKERSEGEYGAWFLKLKDLEGSAPDEYALHGTNEPEKIGTWASRGCIRHLNEDIMYLADLLPIGTIVWTK